MDEFRDAAASKALLRDIHRLSQGVGPLAFMEFCGGHTHAMMRYGLRAVLGPNLRMLSGPGCPVCVTSQSDVDKAVYLASLEGVTVATYGDLVRVPGSQGSLQEARARGADVRVIYSALDALTLAEALPEREVVLLGIGFETTAPGTAIALSRALARGIRNFRILSLHKLTPPAMRAIIEAGEVKLDGVMGPGHVTTVIGGDAWGFLPEEYGLGCAVSGFEPADMLLAIRELVKMRVSAEPAVVNCYRRSVTAAGNRQALSLLEEAFVVSDADWRGLGAIPASGLRLREELAGFDAERAFAMPRLQAAEPQGCRCGEVLRGVTQPEDCPLFGSACSPASPVGPCMVSSEGACAASYEMGAVIHG